MRYIVGPAHPGEQADDVTQTVAGELLFLGIDCDDEQCLCQRVFTGIGSGLLTTTALVADLDLDEATVIDMTCTAMSRMFRIALDLIPRDEAQEVVRQLSGLAYLRSPGQVVRVADLEMGD